MIRQSFEFIYASLSRTWYIESLSLRIFDRIYESDKHFVQKVRWTLSLLQISRNSIFTTVYFLQSVARSTKYRTLSLKILHSFSFCEIFYNYFIYIVYFLQGVDWTSTRRILRSSFNFHEIFCKCDILRRNVIRVTLNFEEFSTLFANFITVSFTTILCEML